MSISQSSFLEPTYKGKIIFFLHNYLFHDKPTSRDTSLSLNDKFAECINEPRHDVHNGTKIICLGHPLPVFDAAKNSKWCLHEYRILGTPDELKNLVSYRTRGTSLNIYVYTYTNCIPIPKNEKSVIKFFDFVRVK